VETISENLGFLLADNSSQGSNIENRIQKSISFGDTQKLEPGKAYTIKLHLGMNSVEFDANVVGWEDVAPADVDLPANVPFFTAAAAGTGAATIPAVVDKNKFLFGINGLNGGEAVSATAKSYTWNSDAGAKTEEDKYQDDGTGTEKWSTETPIYANGSGYQVITLNTTNNTTTTNRIQVVEYKGQSSQNLVTMTFTQLAAPLALKAPSSTDIATATGEGVYEYTLQRTGALYGFFCKGYSSTVAECYKEMDNEDGGNAGPSPKIQVWRNGTPLTWVKSGTAAASLETNQFTFTDEGKLTVKENFVKDDVIKVTLKTGDAPEETITWKVTQP
jgi:hypothetical protein